MSCYLLEFHKLYDCDWFENKRTAPRRYRVKRKSGREKDEINAKLDMLLEALELIPPKLGKSGTFGVYLGGSGDEVFRGSHEEATDYIKRCQSGFPNHRLILRRIEIQL